jgi:hypothetical protein
LGDSIKKACLAHLRGSRLFSLYMMALSSVF